MYTTCMCLHRHTLNQGPLRLAAESSAAPDGGKTLIHRDDITILLNFFGIIVDMGANSTRFYNILSACVATGEHEKVANGIYNYKEACHGLVTALLLVCIILRFV